MNADKKILVLLHGWAMHSEIWGDFASELATLFNVIACDLPKKNSLEEISNAIVAQLNGQSFYLLGWSFGGTVALDVAARYENQVLGVILMAANPCFVARENRAGMSAESFENFVQQFNEKPALTLQRFLNLQTHGFPSVTKELKMRFSRKKLPEFSELKISLALLKNSDLRAVLQKLTCPITVILSDNDALIPIAIAENLKALKLNLTVTSLNSATHAPFVMQPQNCLSIISAFLNGSR